MAHLMYPRFSLRSRSAELSGSRTRWRTLFLTLAAVTLFIGLGLRAGEYQETVTYIDELIVLSEGHTQISRVEEEAKGALDYLARSMQNKESSYPLLPYIIAWLSKGEGQVFSLNTLHNARLVQITISILGLLLFISLAKLARKDSSVLDWPLAFAFSCFALSDSLIFNSQQITPYIFGALAVPASLCLFLRAIDSRSSKARSAYFLLISLLTTGHFLMIFVQAALTLAFGLILWANDEEKNPAKRALKLMKQGLWLSPSLAVLGGFALFVYTQKSDMSVPWWVADYLSDPQNVLNSLLRNLYGVYRESFRILGAGAIFVQSLTVFALIVTLAGGLSLVQLRGKLGENDRNLPHLYLAALCTIGLFIVLYLLRRIPLSPTRHNLILIPFFLVLLFASIEALRLKDLHKKTGVIPALRTLCLIFMISSTYFSLAHFRSYMLGKRETWDSRTVLELAKEKGARSIVSGAWDYSKLRLLLGSACSDGSLTCSFVHDAPQVASGSILVGQSIENFPAIYGGAPGRDKLLTRESDFDYEPYPGIRYWPNNFHIWFVP